MHRGIQKRALSLLMIVLLLAQAGGLCQAYVCHCSVMSEVTFADDCHDANAPACCSHVESEPCPSGREAHQHDPLADLPMMLASPLIAAAVPVAIRDVQAFEWDFVISPANPLRPAISLGRGVPDEGSRPPPSCCPRLTVALLI